MTAKHTRNVHSTSIFIQRAVFSLRVCFASDLIIFSSFTAHNEVKHYFPFRFGLIHQYQPNSYEFVYLCQINGIIEHIFLEFLARINIVEIFWFSIKFKGNHTVAQKNKRLKRIITIQFDDLLLQKAGKCSIYDKIGYFLVLKQIDLIFRSKLHRNFAK